MAADKVFVDTGAFISIADRSDQYHSQGSAHFQYLLESRQPLVTTNFVLDETYTWLKRRLGSQASITFGDEIKRSDQVEVVTVNQEIEGRAWKIFKKYRDQAFSYTDCTSFAVMQILRLKACFSFDIHFEIFGFNIVPSLR